MSRRTVNHLDYAPGLHWFAVFTAVCTLGLIALGGLVTSKGAGMAVPDWPTTYGYNMFLFPVDQWIGGIRYEHTHRLAASWVGLLTTILAVWLWMRSRERWLRWLGVIAFFAVVLQGVLGGLRVIQFKAELGIVHATLAQAFLVLVAAIALFTSKWWKRAKLESEGDFAPRWIRGLAMAGAVLIFAQLMLGAAMRHEHAGLAVPDFPLAYGQLWPETSPEFIERVNRQRLSAEGYEPITAGQIHLHMTHRLGALAILIVVVSFAGFCIRRHGWRSWLSRRALVWAFLIFVQAGFGVWTVLSAKAADIATAHVVIGAMSLLWGAFLVVATRSIPESVLLAKPARREGEQAPADGAMAVS